MVAKRWKYGQIIGFSHVWPTGDPLKTIAKSEKLSNVCYDIRGPVLDRARQMEEEGQKIIKLNIGNLAVFGFDAPEEIQQDMIRNLPSAAAYSDSKGIFSARKAVMHYTQQQGIKGVTLEDIYLGNGASELIVMATNGLLNNGDELLLPALSIGAKGAIGSTYTFAAPEYLKTTALYQQCNNDQARENHSFMVEVIRIFARYPSVPAQKAIMKMLGFDMGPCRLPLVTLNKTNYDKLHAELDAVGFFERVPSIPMDRKEL